MPQSCTNQMPMKRLAALLTVIFLLFCGLVPATAASAAAGLAHVNATVNHSGPHLHAGRHSQHSVGASTQTEDLHTACATTLCFACATVLPLPPAEIVLRNGLFFRIDNRSSPLIASEPVPLERPPKTIG